MRLREIRSLLGKYSAEITFTDSSLSNGTIQVTGLEKTINTINKLSVLGFLDPDIKRLKKYPTIYSAKSPDDVMILNSKDYESIRKIVLTAKEKIEGFQTLIDNSVPKNEKDVVSIKLPQYEDLDDLSHFFKSLNLALKSGLLNDSIKGSFKFQNFDTGSMWIDVVIGSAVIQFFGKIIETAQNIQQKSIETQIMKQNLKNLKLQGDALEQIKVALDLQINTVVDAEIKNLTGETQFDPEALGELKLSVKTFAQLLHEGTQFHPQLNAPAEVVNSFPDIQSQIEGTAGLIDSISLLNEPNDQ